MNHLKLALRQLRLRPTLSFVVIVMLALGIGATTAMVSLYHQILVRPLPSPEPERLVNLSAPTRHLTTRIPISVAYGSDLARVREALVAAALASPHVDPQRAPVVLVTKLADFSVNFLLVFWARDYSEQGLATSEVYEEIHRRFREAGIEIPLPASRVIHTGAVPAGGEGE